MLEQLKILVFVFINSIIKIFALKDIAKYLKLPPVKLHCSMLAEDAIKSAIDDYKSKNK